MLLKGALHQNIIIMQVCYDIGLVWFVCVCVCLIVQSGQFSVLFYKGVGDPVVLRLHLSKYCGLLFAWIC